MGEILQLDQFDRRILRELQVNSELSMTELAEKVGLSHTPCWRRIKRLEEAGVIAGRAVLIDPKSIGYEINIFASIKIKQHDEATLEAFEKAIEQCPQIVECFSMSGEADYVMRVIATSVSDYELLVKKTILHLPGVASISSSFALKCIKLTTKMPV
jgi:Lrp/AsnC family transcriptional regulator